MKKTIYDLEPKVVDKGEIMIIGIKELYINGVGVNTNEGVVGVYKLLSKSCKANYESIIKHAVDGSTTIGVNMPSSNSKSNSPIFEMEDGKPDEFYHIAATEVNSLDTVPEDMVGKVIPPSKYIVFSCQADVDPETNTPRKVDWDPLFTEGYRKFKENGCLGYKEKNYSLEIAYRSNGSTIDRFELLIPVE